MNTYTTDFYTRLPEEFKTKWYNWPVVPVRDGWYETNWCPVKGQYAMRLYFLGAWYRLSEGKIKRSDFGKTEGDQWRGLTEDFFRCVQ